MLCLQPWRPVAAASLEEIVESGGYRLDIGLLQFLDEVLSEMERKTGTISAKRGRALQLGCGAGVEVDYLKSWSGRGKRYVACIEPEGIPGPFKRPNGARQQVVNILDEEQNTASWREKVGLYHLVFSIQEAHWFPLKEHAFVAKFLADRVVRGGKLVFAAGFPGMPEVGEGARGNGEWKQIFEEAGLEFDGPLTEHVHKACDSFANRKTVLVFSKPGALPSAKEFQLGKLVEPAP